jgi:hypothetical protein
MALPNNGKKRQLQLYKSFFNEKIPKISHLLIQCFCLLLLIVLSSIAVEYIYPSRERIYDFSSVL